MAVTINGSNTPTAGGVTYGDGTTYATTAAGTSGQVLTSAGSGAPTWASPAAGGFSNMTVFTSSGTWTIPAGVTKCKVTVVGGGGGGGSGSGTEVGGGGGAGGAAIKIYTLVGSTASVVVGTGGAGSTTINTAGSAGNTSSFTNNGVTVSATGGEAGIAPNTFTNAYGGTGSGGDINFEGGWGNGGKTTSTAYFWGGMGGASIFGANGASRLGNSGTDRQNSNYGGGGGGGPQNASAGFFFGGNGGNGVVIIEY